MREVAASVAAPPQLVPWFGRLFKGVGALGSSPRRVARVLEELGIGSRSLVLDLACGKGAVAIELAARIGCRVVAVDACEEFVESGRREAERRGVGRLVEFRVGDVRGEIELSRRADAAIMLNLFGFEESVLLLRGLVKPGGVYVCDDAVGRSLERSGDRAAPTRGDARAVFERFGDEVVREMMMSPSEVGRMSASLVRRLSRNAREIGREEPRLKGALASFVAAQRRAGGALRGEMRPVVWWVRKGGTSGAAGSAAKSQGWASPDD